MIITEKSFILIQYDLTSKGYCRFTLDSRLEDMLRRKMRPILWHRCGMFCVVPVEILQNALDSIDMYAKLGMDNPQVVIDWKQCWPVTDGRPMTALAGLDY